MKDNLLLGFENALITQNVSYRYAFARQSDITSVRELFEKELTKFPKKNGWWDPPKNMAINSALMGLNLWKFTLLPFRAHLRAYHAATERLPEGIVIHPNWDSVNNDLYADDDLSVAEVLIRVVKSTGQTLQEMVTAEIKWIETKFHVQVPEFIPTKLRTEIQKIATRRWGADRLRLRDTLIPFDGSKSVELGAFDR